MSLPIRVQIRLYIGTGQNKAERVRYLGDEFGQPIPLPGAHPNEFYVTYSDDIATLNVPVCRVGDICIHMTRHYHKSTPQSRILQDAESIAGCERAALQAAR